MSELKPCPFCGMGLTLDIDEEGGVAILHSLKGEKNCWFPSIVEIETPVETTLEEDEFDSMPIEKINQYLREHGYDPEKVGLRGKILVEALTKNIIAREIIQRFLNNEGGCRFCDYDKYLPLDAPKNGHEENCLYLAARAYLANDTSTVVKRDLSDAEIEELEAQEAESRGDK